MEYHYDEEQHLKHFLNWNLPVNKRIRNSLLRNNKRGHLVYTFIIIQCQTFYYVIIHTLKIYIWCIKQRYLSDIYRILCRIFYFHVKFQVLFRFNRRKNLWYILSHRIYQRKIFKTACKYSGMNQFFCDQKSINLLMMAISSYFYSYDTILLLYINSIKFPLTSFSVNILKKYTASFNVYLMLCT